MPIDSPFPQLIVPDESTYAMLNRACVEYDCHIALVESDTRNSVTYRELGVCGTIFAANLSRQLHFTKHDCLMVCLPNGISFVVAAMGTWRCGGVFTAIAPTVTVAEMRHCMTISKPKVVLCEADILHTVMEAVQVLSPSAMIIVRRPTDTHPNAVLPPQCIDYRQMMEDTKEPAPDVHIAPRVDPFLICYSSGTMGLPKGVLVPHRYGPANVQTFLSPFFITPAEGEVQLLHLPLHHGFGLIVLLGYLSRGVHIVLYTTKFEAKTFLRLLHKYKIRLLYTVPPVVQCLAEASSSFDLSSLRCIYSGSAAISRNTQETLRARLPKLEYILQLCGMSEHGLSHMAPPFSPNEKPQFLSSIGVLVHGYEGKIIDVVDGRELNENEVGEICLRCNHMLLHYVDNAVAQ